MNNLIKDRVEAARQGKNPYVIGRMASGWLVIGDVQPTAGYCLLLADPLAANLNALAESDRIAYCLDVARIGDALLKVTTADGVNYETLGNEAPGLHTHISPRYPTEPAVLRRLPRTLAYPRVISRRFDPQKDGRFIKDMREALSLASLEFSGLAVEPRFSFHVP